MLMIFFSGIQLVSSGVLGAYLAKGYLEVKERPLYIVDEKDLIENKDIEDNEEFKIKNQRKLYISIIVYINNSFNDDYLYSIENFPLWK